MNRLLFFFFVSVMLLSCTAKKITQPADYNFILENKELISKQAKKVEREIKFWSNRLSKDTSSYVDLTELANYYMSLFKLTGQVKNLHTADSFMHRVNEKLAGAEPGIYFAMSQNAITQHRFADAWQYIVHADSLTDNKYTSALLQFDAGMELGLFHHAVLQLRKISDKNGFDFLIRKAKLEDHEGRLDNAIGLMELALKRAEESGKKSLVLWAKSNLADMYGHAGRVENAYRYYLDVLKMDSSYIYALKGIAWIAYSHDHNTDEAKRILHYILSQTKMPELWLMLAEIAEWEGDIEGKKSNMEKFLTEVTEPGYGDMYNKYLIAVYAEELRDFEKAEKLALKEVNTRPTPETYGWLAWVHFQKGDKQNAAGIVKNYVLEKSFEPECLLTAAYILEAYGDGKKAKEFFDECMSSGFEIGPVALAKLQNRKKLM